MNDLAERLRCDVWSFDDPDARKQAADEIERLQAELEEEYQTQLDRIIALKTERDRYREALDRAYTLSIQASVSSFRKDHSRALLELKDLLRQALKEQP